MTRFILALLSIGLLCVVVGCGSPAATSEDNVNGAIGDTDSGNAPAGGDSDNSNDNVGEDLNENSSDNGNDNRDGAEPTPAPLTVASRGLLNREGEIDLRFASFSGCGGNNVSPQLSWTGAPDETQSFAVVIFDRSAGNFIHWMVFDIAAGVTNINEGGPAPGGQTLNDYEQGLFGYGGPCPPPGERHTYVFRVYALDIRNTGLTAGQLVSLAEWEALVAGHVVAVGELTAPFARP